MSAFQAFAQLSERRKSEREQAKRKRLMIAGASASVVAILAVVGVAAVLYRSNHSAAPSSREASAVSKYVEVICSPTDYKGVCISHLSKAVSENAKPKDVISAAVSVIGDEASKAFNYTASIKAEDPQVKAAIEDCSKFFGYVKDDIARTLSDLKVIPLEQIPSKERELRIWLSGVMTFQTTCVGLFPDGNLKSKTQQLMETAEQLTDNALAIFKKSGSLLSELNVNIGGAASGRLLAEGVPEFHEDGYPSWVSDEHRRHLKSRPSDNLKPNVTVAKDGSGNFTSINDALRNMPAKYTGRYVIYVKQGVYEEHVVVNKTKIDLTMFGDGSQKSIVTGSKSVGFKIKGTALTATFAVEADGFIAMAMGFRNTAGPEGHQAVALRVKGDSCVFLNCRMEAYQDTLYAQSHKQFYRSCVITGTIDFIFGDALAVFQNCNIFVRRPMDGQFNAVTAHGRNVRTEHSGFVIQRCKIMPDETLAPVQTTVRSYLGRPWKVYAVTVTMETEIGDLIQKAGYTPWDDRNLGLDTVFYAEYKNTGPGADTSGRVKWRGFKVITDRQEAANYTVGRYVDQSASWIRDRGVPVRMGFYE